MIPYVDLGTDSEESVDFPIFCKKLVNEVKKSPDNRGVLICGTGIGMSICANRDKAIRAALCYNSATARLARQHNDANILVLGGRFISSAKAKKMLDIFLNTNCFGDKYQKRMELIDCI